MTTGTVPDDERERAVTAADVQAALAQLNIEYRQALTEICFGKRPVEEAAQVLGVPAAMVIAWTYHGLRQLRDTVGIMPCGG
jgi:DNA-directed RNA polymerase specialized sigma24 family protein